MNKRVTDRRFPAPHLPAITVPVVTFDLESSIEVAITERSHGDCHFIPDWIQCVLLYFCLMDGSKALKKTPNVTAKHTICVRSVLSHRAGRDGSQPQPGLRMIHILTSDPHCIYKTQETGQICPGSLSCPLWSQRVWAWQYHYRQRSLQLSLNHRICYVTTLYIQ